MSAKVPKIHGRNIGHPYLTAPAVASRWAEFFITLSSEAPEVLISLDRDVFAAFVKVHEEELRRRRNGLLAEEVEGFFFERLHPLNGPRPAGEMLALRNALLAWAKRHNLRHVQACVLALYVLSDWLLDSEARARREIVALPYGPVESTRSEPLGPELVISPWMTHEKRAEFVARAKSAAIDYIRKQRKPRQGKSRSGEKHLAWLARYQCGGESKKALAADLDVNRKAVQYALKTRASELGLPLRGANAKRAKKPR